MDERWKKPERQTEAEGSLRNEIKSNSTFNEEDKSDCWWVSQRMKESTFEDDEKEDDERRLRDKEKRQTDAQVKQRRNEFTIRRRWADLLGKFYQREKNLFDSDKWGFFFYVVGGQCQTNCYMTSYLHHLPEAQVAKQKILKPPNANWACQSRQSTHRKNHNERTARSHFESFSWRNLVLLALAPCWQTETEGANWK